MCYFLKDENVTKDKKEKKEGIIKRNNIYIDQYYELLREIYSY